MTEKRHSHTSKSPLHHHPVNEKNLLVVTLLNFVITIAEFAGGILSNSLALLSDALHNLGDTFATFIAYLATLIGRKEANPKKTFGYKRIEILAAVLNAVILIIMSIYLLKEAYLRWKEPETINSMIMLVVGMIGLLANVLAVMILRKDSMKSINVRAAYVHLIGDSLSSVVVILGGLLIQLFEIYWIDPLITLLICIYILRAAFVILKESVDILMQSTPSALSLSRVKQAVEQFPEVSNIHHLHAWNMTEHQVHLEAHVELKTDLKLSELKHTQQKIEKLLQTDFHVHHVTLQFEFGTDHSSRLIHQDH
ncbi:MAG TPA: cation transporter [Bacteroides sp.]|mgnify:CR=1 FL=1|nr:cation transporter [Bacteroides sp.]